jgi:hypothetical protein
MTGTRGGECVTQSGDPWLRETHSPRQPEGNSMTDSSTSNWEVQSVGLPRPPRPTHSLVNCVARTRHDVAARLAPHKGAHHRCRLVQPAE